MIPLFSSLCISLNPLFSCADCVDSVAARFPPPALPAFSNLFGLFLTACGLRMSACGLCECATCATHLPGLRSCWLLYSPLLLFLLLLPLLSLQPLPASFWHLIPNFQHCDLHTQRKYDSSRLNPLQQQERQATAYNNKQARNNQMQRATIITVCRCGGRHRCISRLHFEHRHSLSLPLLLLQSSSVPPPHPLVASR